jgi:hypothetical protein
MLKISINKFDFFPIVLFPAPEHNAYPKHLHHQHKQILTEQRNMEHTIQKRSYNELPFKQFNQRLNAASYDVFNYAKSLMLQNPSDDDEIIKSSPSIDGSTRKCTCNCCSCLLSQNNNDNEKCSCCAKLKMENLEFFNNNQHKKGYTNQTKIYDGNDESGHARKHDGNGNRKYFHQNPIKLLINKPNEVILENFLYIFDVIINIHMWITKSCCELC